MLAPYLRDIRNALGSIRRARPALRNTSILTVALILLWLYTIHQGERAVFASNIDACKWPASETWPDDAKPHHAVLIADPQLVDAHTYPGRPWPLSSLTEFYTDRYMARNYKLINAKLDPDSIVFLGDMFDGGREWAPDTTKPLTAMQEWAMGVRSPATTEVPKGRGKVTISDPDWKHENKGGMTKRDPESAFRQSASDEQRQPTAVTKEIELGAFNHGENGRWKSYGNKYWEQEYNRFGKIFLAKEQLYSAHPHAMEILDQVPQDSFNEHNGAPAVSRYGYRLHADPRTILASLPGNHDLGFGSGVQLSVRARYKWHFGEMNRVDVLGNHTFVSIDALSLAAWSQFETTGRESTPEDSHDRAHIYASPQTFLDNLPAAAQQVTQRNLDHFFGGKQNTPWLHKSVNVESISESEKRPSRSTGQHQLPVVLLSHVPLYREAGTSCGAQRERRGALSLTGGYQYQNVLTKTLTDTIISKLSRIGPLQEIFSGDDHDYCDIVHPSTQKAVREETVKSFSWAMGVRLPGFLLVSLYNPIDAEGKSLRGGVTIETQLCLLPDQLSIFIRYGTLAGITLVVLLLRAIVLALREKQDVEEEDAHVIHLSKLFSSGLTKVQQLTNGYKPVSKHRQRASSSAIKPPANMNLSVQRSSNARARSVSPGVGFGSSSPFQTPPLVDQAGYYPSLRYHSNPGSDDEESRIGDMDYLEDDTQAKWRKRRRPRSRTRRVWDELVESLLLVGGIAFCYYIVLVRTG